MLKKLLMILADDKFIDDMSLCINKLVDRIKEDDVKYNKKDIEKLMGEIKSLKKYL
tara:strand:+ start:44 stop:211 length:168 start_codon:yes stop_codon:yes gene_type:complete